MILTDDLTRALDAAENAEGTAINVLALCLNEWAIQLTATTYHRCRFKFDGECLEVISGSGTDYPLPVKDQIRLSEIPAISNHFNELVGSFFDRLETWPRFNPNHHFDVKGRNHAH